MSAQFTEGLDFEAFRQDPKTIAAVERNLQLAIDLDVIWQTVEDDLPPLGAAPRYSAAFAEATLAGT